MIKRYLCLNLELVCGRLMAAQNPMPENRLVFAKGSSGGSGSSGGGSSGSGPGAEAEKEKMTMANLEDRLVAMPDEGKLSEEAVTEALELIEKGGDEAKQEILKHAVKVEDGRMKENDFVRRIKLYKRKKQNPEIETEATRKEKAEKTAEKATETAKKKGRCGGGCGNHGQGEDFQR